MRKAKLAIALIIALSGFSYLLITGLKESGVYYVRVGEFLNSPHLRAKRVRVEGRVVEGSVRRGAKLEFEITDGEGRLRVIYTAGGIPPAFGEGAPVVVEGRYNAELGLFEAVRLITKCPSKYEAEDGDR